MFGCITTCPANCIRKSVCRRRLFSTLRCIASTTIVLYVCKERKIYYYFVRLFVCSFFRCLSDSPRPCIPLRLLAGSPTLENRERWESGQIVFLSKDERTLPASNCKIICHAQEISQPSTTVLRTQSACCAVRKCPIGAWVISTVACLIPLFQHMWKRYDTVPSTRRSDASGAG